MASEVRIAVEGCGHGSLHAIYASVDEACKQKGWTGVDLLLVGGDFQAVRNAADLATVSVPAKFRAMGDFHEYYSGQRTAPHLTVFVGGNHEASSHLTELHYGGWVAPGIFYLGAANVLRLGALRIAGVSGIWKGFDYRRPHLERLPYNAADVKSVYHVRELDVRKLLQVRTQVDVAVSHDWPQGVEWHGHWEQLFRFKPHLEPDARSGRLGSVAAKQLLDRLRPRYWFSAHLHCKYAAVVRHRHSHASQQPPSQPPQLHASPRARERADVAHHAKNTDEIDLDLDEDASADESHRHLDHGSAAEAPVANGQSNSPTPAADPAAATEGVDDALAEARAALPASFSRPPPPEAMEHPPDISNTQTNFLALDKCLPGRHFLQLVAIPIDAAGDRTRPLKLEYDAEWLAITRAFNLAEPPQFGDPDARVPPIKTQAEYRTLIDRERKWVDEHVTDFTVPEDFVVTAPVYDGGDIHSRQYQQVREFPNPQTAAYCHLLQIPNPLAISEQQLNHRHAVGPRPEPESFAFGSGGGFDRGREGRGRDRGRGGRARGGRDRGARARGRVLFSSQQPHHHT